MKTNPRVLLIASVLCAFGSFALGQSPNAVSSGSGNTIQNEPSPSANDDVLRNSSTDLALTKRIRRRIAADKTLSMTAHNVKIVSVNGNVTLSGVVRSEDEKIAIGVKAVAAAGNGHVVNDLSVVAL